ncbi:uncharacterized protein LOC129797025 isoform X2 [Lutzomyia longipalpis]|uniref:uncharacterized protein LOC129797025 isoform X2 n=1 Tax=Lutzomyia longipalpis TaxID=7200 RepID=UPI0024846D0D|nr:uncharacterized protein LOC129797025 isoform X2 [Lutzomyia longipalpis]
MPAFLHFFCSNSMEWLQLFFVGFLIGATGTTSVRPPPNHVVSISANCTRDFMNLRLDLGRPFKGVIFAKEFAEECHSRGNLTSTVTLRLPTSGCGVRSEPQEDGSMELSVRIVVQMDGKLRQSADVVKIAKCTLLTDMMSMNVISSHDKPVRNGRMKADLPGSSRVRVWLELGGSGGSGAVEVGQATTLGVRAILPGSVGVRVVDCIALDGLGEASQKLLDERGCPIDEQVMPALLVRFRPIEEGWSKPHKDDLVEKLFQTTFPAFKFPDREHLHVSCGVQLCRGRCPKVDCRRRDERFMLPTERHLARIEVFNSLAVTAPQIELDSRSRGDRRGNMTLEQYQRLKKLRSDGTLCLSQSFLALSFCILGVIFLVAIIVALCCLLRSRMRSNTNGSSYRNSGASIFSSSSGSQSRFGSKLLIPYSGSLPYGRVY